MSATLNGQGSSCFTGIFGILHPRPVWLIISGQAGYTEKTGDNAGIFHGIAGRWVSKRRSA
jgi:hypothetical protein